jgi:DNA topoisomerase II
MYATVIGLAQSFVGKNNINLLIPAGQFGTRAQGGDDAASPRYIFTSLMAITRKILHQADDALLSYLDEDGKKIEPEWYMPVIPLVLVNGADGIGTGWSTKIPNYNPQDIIDNLRRLLNGEEMKPMMPWYRGFIGPIEETDKPGRYKVSGIIKQLENNVVEITELPVGMWTQEMKEFLEKEIIGTEKCPSIVKDYEEHHLERTVHFKVQLTEKGMDAALAEGLENKFKLVSFINTTNMVAFDPEGRIRKYNSAEEILEEFFHLRLEYYQKRKVTIRCSFSLTIRITSSKISICNWRNLRIK